MQQPHAQDLHGDRPPPKAIRSNGAERTWKPALPGQRDHTSCGTARTDRARGLGCAHPITPEDASGSATDSTHTRDRRRRTGPRPVAAAGACGQCAARPACAGGGARSVGLRELPSRLARYAQAARPTADDIEKRAAKHVPAAPPDASLAQCATPCRHCSTIVPASTTAAPRMRRASSAAHALTGASRTARPRAIEPAPPPPIEDPSPAPSRSSSPSTESTRNRSRPAKSLKQAEHQRLARLQYKRLMTALTAPSPVTRPAPPLTVSEALHPGVGASLLYSSALESGKDYVVATRRQIGVGRAGRCHVWHGNSDERSHDLTRSTQS